MDPDEPLDLTIKNDKVLRENRGNEDRTGIVKGKRNDEVNNQERREQSSPLDLRVRPRKRLKQTKLSFTQDDGAKRRKLTIDSSKNARSDQSTQSDRNGDETSQQTVQAKDRPYSIETDNRIKTWKRSVEERKFRVRFKPENAGRKLIEMREDIESMFDSVIEEGTANYDGNDKCQVTINHSDLQSPVFIHLQSLNGINGRTIMNRFESVLNSNKGLTLDESFDISLGILKMKKGGGKTLTQCLLPHLDSDGKHSKIMNKRAIINIICADGEEICAAMAVSALAHRDGMKKSDFDNLVRKDRQCGSGVNSLRSRALKLLHTCGLPSDRALTISELAKFEEHVESKILVVTVDQNVDDPTVIQCSDKTFDKEIYLYLASNHYHAVSNVAALFPGRILCKTCYKSYKFTYKNKHPCNETTACHACERAECPHEGTVLCSECNFVFRSNQCFEHHLSKRSRGEPLCQRRKKCLHCLKVVKGQPLSDHVCHTYKCRFCSEWVFADTHLCYLRKKNMQLSSGRFVFYDFESMTDSISQCEEGYSPKNGSGCGLQKPECEGLCQNDNLCRECHLCTNCSKVVCGFGEHQPNLVVAESACDLCKHEVLTPRSKCRNCGNLCRLCKRDDCAHDCPHEDIDCGLRRVVFKGLDTVDKFCRWAFTPDRKKFIFIAHNAKSYDSVFCLHWLITEARITPKVIYSGAKIMSLQVKNGLDIKFIDSLNFLQMGLSKLPKAFGLKPCQIGLPEDSDVHELAKLNFPHKFNTRENWLYSGPFPSMDMYDVDSMQPGEREQFVKWYEKQEGKTFNLQKELQHYCTIDTSILRLACMTFRDIVAKITSKEGEDGKISYVDCFAHVTLASTVMQCYRMNHMGELYEVTLTTGQTGVAEYKGGRWNLDGDSILSEQISHKKFLSSSIPSIPPNGYVVHSNHSEKSIKWLEYEGSKMGSQISHARSTGEVTIRCGPRKYKVDGYEPTTQTVLEFHGCFYHGCEHSRTAGREYGTVDSRTGFTMKDLKNQTERREREIRAMGYKVKSIYECEYDRMVREDPEMKAFVKNVNIPKRLVTRQAFYGGRTEGFKLHVKADQTRQEQVHYVDVVSLYPAINKYAKMPYGHPTIITRNFDLTLKSYYGLIYAKVLPRIDDYIGALPFRARGKLHFPLCAKCCQSAQVDLCQHTPDERALVGVWCSPELMVAIENGYKVVEIYEVYHYEKTSQYDRQTRKGGLFSEQVDLFLKLKAEASGYPEWVRNDDDKDLFIRQFSEKCGVELDKDQIMPNPSLRSISKLMLNSFWGKLGQRSSLTQTRFVQDSSELHKIAGNAAYEIKALHIVTRDTLALEYCKAEGFEDESNVTNEVLAAFTTCYGRLEIQKYMRMVGDNNLIYTDTDSLVFSTREIRGKDGVVRFENYPPMGDALGELSNELPQNTWITEFVCSAPKSYSYTTSDDKECVKFKGVTRNGKNMNRVNFNAVKELVLGERPSITLAPQIQFSKSKFEGVITNLPLVKKLVHTFDKRIVLPNMNTLPYGYVGCLNN